MNFEFLEFLLLIKNQKSKRKMSKYIDWIKKFKESDEIEKKINYLTKFLNLTLLGDVLSFIPTDVVKIISSFLNPWPLTAVQLFVNLLFNNINYYYLFIFDDKDTTITFIHNRDVFYDSFILTLTSLMKNLKIFDTQGFPGMIRHQKYLLVVI